MSAVPEPGQLVEVRRRQWVVMDVAASSLPGPASRVPQHLVSLTSIDDDALGETLDAVWEIEPGAPVLETAGLPGVDGYDPPQQISAFLDAVRWGAATSADHMLLQSPFRSGIEIQDHQLDPLVRAIDMSRTSLLIADDVGLGKTIEAGLVVQELLIRHRARSVLIVCPASLQVKWKNEMWEKFGLDFRIVNTEYVKQLRRERGLHANPWTSFPRLVTSMDWMKSGEGLRLIKDVLPPHISYPRKFDILIVDEAHNVAPSGASHYALPSQRTRLIRRIAPHFQHRMFLTATPHNGYQESFTALLELLDDQRFARSVEPDPAQLQRVMVRRLKTDLVDKDGNRIYPEREILALPVEYTHEEREARRLLNEYTKSRSESVKGTPSAMGTDFIHKLLKKRLFSSPMAFATTLAKHRNTLAKGRKKKSDGMEERILRKAIAKCAEDYADDSALERAEAEAVATATEMALPLTADQEWLIQRLMLELIARAQGSLFLVTFVNYGAKALVEALNAAAERGVAIRMLLEGSMETTAKLAAKVPSAEVFVWADDAKPPSPGKTPATVHAKCVVADRSEALVTSANLTDHPLDLNMELDIHIMGGREPEQLHDHLNALVATLKIQPFQASGP